MKAVLRLAVLFVFVCGAVPGLIAQPQGKSRPKLRVVIDASYDGGAWWFPQGPPPFDPQTPHQGVALANYLKRRGWAVIEIPRETKFTNQLRGASIVVRMGLFGTYAESKNDPRNHTKRHEQTISGSCISWIVLPGEPQSRKIGHYPRSSQFE